MSRYFCLVRFIEIIKEKYRKVTKLIIYFDLRKSIEKTKSKQLQIPPYGIVIVDNEKKSTLDYSKLIEIYAGETNDEDPDDTYEIVFTMCEGKNKTLNTNKNFQLLDASPDLKKFTTKDKKILEYFLSQIINNVNSILLKNMIRKKKSVSVKL
jgi:hypothetical protein